MSRPFEFCEEPNEDSFRVITKFNEDEVVSVEVVEFRFCSAIEHYYVAQGYGVVTEDQ